MQQGAVTVAVATRGRPAGCRRLVEGVLDQQLPAAVRVQVLVVDNAAEPSDLRLPASVEVVHEPRPGVSHARNRAIAHAIDDADVIVFVDDDEEPADAHWLRRLLDGLDHFDADLTAGPVLSVHAPTTPSWVAEHSLFRRERFPSGTLRPEARTGNLAVRTELLRRLDGWFDPSLALSGGEDTELTRRAVGAGARIAWVDDAAVVEHVPPARATLAWLLRRSLRIGTNRIQFLRLGGAGPGAYTLHLGGATVEIVGGGLLAALTPVLGRRRGALALGRAARGVGAWYGVLRGGVVEEYRTPS